MPGPAGFRGAPITKGIAILSAAASLLWLSEVLEPQRRRIPKPLLFCTFSHVGALIFGSGLVYHSRALERQSGSAKHAALVGLSIGLQLLILILLPWSMQLPSGPLPFIFASLTLFTLETPAMQRFSLFGARLTDKVRPCKLLSENSLGPVHAEMQTRPKHKGERKPCIFIPAICRYLRKRRGRSCSSPPHAAPCGAHWGACCWGWRTTAMLSACAAGRCCSLHASAEHARRLFPECHMCCDVAPA